MLRPPAARPGEINHALIDRFTLAHVSIGAGYALANFSFAIVLVLAVLWEVVEDPLKARLPRLFPNATGDTFRNATGDVLAVLCGWGAVQHLMR